MYIEWLQIQNVRNLTNIRIQPASQLNILVGPNASGKTSILEAIYLLSRARSFRTARTNEVIQHKKPSLLVTAGLRYSQYGLVNTGIEKGPGSTVIHFNGDNIKKISDQARNIPLILVAPDVQNLVLGTPKQRRHWLDWAMFHVEPAYLDDWHDYHKALRQRNSALKNNRKTSSPITGWEQVMTEKAGRINEQRQHFIDLIAENLKTVANGIISFKPRIDLYKGWQGDQPLSDSLLKHRENDRQVGYTRHGIHCADVHFYADELPLASSCSRGQIKLFLVLLLISQAKTIEGITGNRPLYLLDDFRAEIDKEAGGLIMELMKQQQAQVFFTSTEFRLDGKATNDIKMFHVEHGELVKVVE